MRFNIEHEPGLAGSKVTVEAPVISVMPTPGVVKHDELGGRQGWLSDAQKSPNTPQH